MRPRLNPIAAILLLTGASLSAATPVSSPAEIAGCTTEWSSGLLGEGTRWETPYYIVDSSKPGPTVLVVGGLHGNEPSGAAAADEIRKWRIESGRLVVVPRANPIGLDADVRWLPNWRNNRALRDANRNFPRTGEVDEARTDPCKNLWTFAKEQEPDWVLDLHEGFDFHVSNSKSVGTSVIYDGRDPVLRELANGIVDGLNATIDNPDRRFSHMERGPVNGGLARASSDRLGARSFIFETTFRDQPLELRSRQHRYMVSRVLLKLGMIPSSFENPLGQAAAAEPTPPYPGMKLPGGAVRRVALHLDEAHTALEEALRRQMAGWDVEPETIAWRWDDNAGSGAFEVSITMAGESDERSPDGPFAELRHHPDAAARAEALGAFINHRCAPERPAVALHADADMPANRIAFVVTDPNAPVSRRARMVRRAVALLITGEPTEADAIALLRPAEGDRTMAVAIYDSKGMGGNGHLSLRRSIRDLPGVAIEFMCPEDVRDGILTGFDVAMFPGGRGTQQGAALGDLGRRNVREFVAAGGGYFGVCAGAYLATCRLPEYMFMLRSYHQIPWALGRGTVELELTERGRELLGSDDHPVRFECRYNCGPMFLHEDGSVPDIYLPHFEVLARFRTTVDPDSEAGKKMVGSPAIVTSEYGKGRVLLVSPHPESHRSLNWLLQAAVKYIGPRSGVGE